MVFEKRELGEISEQQKVDVNNFERLKKFARENLVGLSAPAISIGGIITTIIVGARKAIATDAQATGKFAKAVN